MRWLALPAGIILLAATLLDVFHTLVVPRAARGRLRLTKILFRLFWRPVRWFGIRFRTAQARERFLAFAAPGFFMGQLVIWAALAVVAYALIYYSPPFSGGLQGTGGATFANALYFSGSTLFTIGFGDVVVSGAARAVAVAEGATGLGLVAVVIAYLPVFYQAFNRREVGILLLDARAGSPPSGPELLRRMLPGDGGEALGALFVQWESWAADVLETHLSYPLLAYFRSPHDNTSWVTSLGAVLDGATLVLAALDGGPQDQARMLYATGVHAVEDLFYYFRRPKWHSVIERAEFDEVLRDLKDRGAALRPADEAWDRFHTLRKAYGGRLTALAVMLAAPPSEWIGDRSTIPEPEAERRS